MLCPFTLRHFTQRCGPRKVYFRTLRHRTYSTKPPPDESYRSRFRRIQSKLPKFLQPYSERILNAPVSHITSFLILHEATAIAPVLGFAAIFHYTNWLPPYISEGKWVSEGMEKAGRYFRKKGWLGEHDEEGIARAKRGRWWNRGEGGTRLVVEFATAYAITKALLPLRLILSVWATPWFARIGVVPVISVFTRLLKRG